jgi:hypothetical protein
VRLRQGTNIPRLLIGAGDGDYLYEVIGSGGEIVRVVGTVNDAQDTYIDDVRARGRDIFLVLTKQSLSESLPQVYARRFAQKVIAVGVYNEVDSMAGGDGSSDEADKDDVELHLGEVGRAFRSINPAVKVVSPALVGAVFPWWDMLLNNLVDVIALDIYATEPEDVDAYLDRYRPFGRPFWITEFGRPNDVNFMHRFVQACRKIDDVTAVFSYFPSPAAKAGAVNGQGDLPRFILGNSGFSERHPEIGLPIGNERYLAGGYSVQPTTLGKIEYHADANASTFTEWSLT